MEQPVQHPCDTVKLSESVQPTAPAHLLFSSALAQITNSDLGPIDSISAQEQSSMANSSEQF